MRRKLISWTTLAVLAVGLLLLTACYGDGVHGQPRESLDVGDKAPCWGELPATDGNSYSMDDFETPLLVVAFACHHCPTVVTYEDRIIQLQADYADKGVQLVALNPNAIYPLSRMKDRAEEKEYNFPYIMDESKESGHKYGATNTPHMFVLDEDRVVRYKGAVDDSNNPANVQVQHLRNALDALLEGNDPPVAVTRARGCTVKYGCVENYRARFK